MDIKAFCAIWDAKTQKEGEHTSTHQQGDAAKD
jgi:hypothetical protein